MNEMKTLTMGGKTYDSFPDQTARDGVVAVNRRIDNLPTGGGEGGGSVEYNRINVRDYGAVGDGATNDQPAIWTAWQAAKALILQDIPCELYFPAGTYGFLNGGMRFALPSGKGGLRITGAGRETTTIRYLADWQPIAQYGGSVWYAIDVCPESNGVTGDYDTYIHDVAITGLTVYDPDPCSHAWHPDKGDSGKEENHGVNIGHCLRASVTECQFITVGDEAIDIYSCSDVVVMNNHLVGCPGAGSAGGAIAICDGCNGVVVSNNTVNGSALDETLDNGKVIEKMNFGIAVESLGIPVRNVVIANNVVRNIQGNGINLGATGADSGMYNIIVEGNIIQGCNNGVSDEGAYPKVGVTINNNIITDCTKLRNGSGYGIFLEAPGFTAVSIRGNTIRNIDAVGAYVQGVDSLIEGNVFENIGAEAVYVVNSATIRDCNVKNTGVVGGLAAINCYGDAVYRVYGCKLTGVRQTKGIFNATEVSDTIIEMVDADGNRVTKEMCVDSDRLKRLVNCQMDGYFSIRQSNALVQGVTLNCSQQWQPAVKVSANGVVIAGCNINHTYSKDAIAEQSGYNYNLFANNIVNRPITTVGAQTVAVNNVDTRTTA